MFISKVPAIRDVMGVAVMSRTRAGQILLALIVVSAFSAVSASSAAAFGWWVADGKGGEEILKAGVKEPFNSASTVEKAFKVKWGKEFLLECKGLQYNKGFIEGTIGLGATSFEFKECKVSATKKECKLEKESISTEAIKSTIKQNGEKVEFPLGVKGATLATFVVNGKECGGKTTLKGVAMGEVSEPAVLSTKKSFRFREEKESKAEVEPEKSEPKKAESFEGDSDYSAEKGWSAR